MYIEIMERVMPIVMEKHDTHFKQLQEEYGVVFYKH